MNKIIQIIMKRDGLSYEKAKDRVDNVREQMYDLIDAGHHTSVDDMFMLELGLEPDYIIDLF